MKKPESSCVGCPDRKLGCHSECVKYEEFLKLQEEYKEVMRQGRKEYYGSAAPPPYRIPKSRWGRVLKGKRKK